MILEAKEKAQLDQATYLTQPSTPSPIPYHPWQVYYSSLSIFQLIGLEECLKRIHDMISEAKGKANLDQSTKLKALVRT